MSKVIERELRCKCLNQPQIVELKEVSTAAKKTRLHRLLHPWRTLILPSPLPGSQQHLGPNSRFTGHGRLNMPGQLLPTCRSILGPILAAPSANSRVAHRRLTCRQGM